jgi:hypothetical protein
MKTPKLNYFAGAGLALTFVLSTPVCIAEPVRPLSAVELAKFWREAPTQVSEGWILQKSYGVSDLLGTTPYTRVTRVFESEAVDDPETLTRADITVTDTGAAGEALPPLIAMIEGSEDLPPGWSRESVGGLQCVQMPTRDGSLHLFFVVKMRYTIELNLKNIPVQEGDQWLDRFKHRDLPMTAGKNPFEEDEALVVYLDELEPGNNRWAKRKIVTPEEAGESDRAFRALVESQLTTE